MSTNVVVSSSDSATNSDRPYGFPDPPCGPPAVSPHVRLHRGHRAPPQHARTYALPGKFLVPFLTGRLASRDIVAIYNRSSGICFPMPTMEQKAKDLSVPGQTHPKPRPTRPSPPSLL